MRFDGLGIDYGIVTMLVMLGYYRVFNCIDHNLLLPILKFNGIDGGVELVQKLPACSQIQINVNGRIMLLEKRLLVYHKDKFVL